MAEDSFNSRAATGGLAGQDLAILALSSFRSNPAGASLACCMLGTAAFRALSIGGRVSLDTREKTDIEVFARLADGSSMEALVSLKSAVPGMGMADRPGHHAARIPIRECVERGIFPADPVLAGFCLEHFLHGEPMGSLDGATKALLLSHWNNALPVLAAEAILGTGPRKPGWLAVSWSEGSGLPPSGALAMESSLAVKTLLSEPLSISEPRDGRVGLVGSRLVSIQRGQALSVGEQRDVQIKINAMALARAALAYALERLPPEAGRLLSIPPGPTSQDA